MTSIEKLNRLGLSGRDARVFAALLQAEWLSVREIAKTADLTITNAYPALERLRRRGMVTINRNKLKRYSAVMPSAAFQELIEKERAQTLHKDILLKELDCIHEKRQSSKHKLEGLEVLGTDPAAFGAVRKRLREAKRDVLITNAFSYHKWTQAEIRKVDSGEQETLKRGVKVRCIYSPSQLALKLEMGRMKDNVRAGEEARVSACVPINSVVVDDDMAVFSLPDSDSKREYTVYRANERQLIMVLRLMFEQLWQGAEELALPDEKPERRRRTLKTSRKGTC